MTEELYKRYRPTKFSEIVGQESAVAALLDMGRRRQVPHTLLFVGPSGCGKTTLARILRRKLGCADADFLETNAAESRGIEMVRGIQLRMGLAPMAGRCRVWLIDECHQLTPDAQGALLKILEDTPGHVYFFLATTDPEKLKPTIRTRATEIKVRLLTDDEAGGLLTSVAAAEGLELPPKVARRLVEMGEGSPRKLLVLLHQVAGLSGEDAMLDALDKADVRHQSIELCRALLKPRPSWKEISGILRTLKDDPMDLRNGVLGYCNSVMLNGGNQSAVARASLIIDEFAVSFYDAPRSRLLRACYEVASAGDGA